MSNEEDQINEIEALQSIFEEEFNLLEENKKFEIKIPIDVPKHGVILKTNLSSPTQTENNNNQKTVDFLFHFLPPITLCVNFPPNYPSKGPPDFQIKANWLDVPQISILCSKLDEVWKELEFSNIVFAWVDSLKYCFDILGIDNDNSIELFNDLSTDKNYDTRAFRQLSDPQTNLLSLLEYNKELLDILFKSEDHDCRLCFDTFGGKEFTKLTCCGSFYCNYCLTEMFKMNIKEGSVQKVRCPNCNQSVHPSLLKPLTTEEEFTRWEYLTFKKAVEGMEDTAYCPRCETLVISDDSLGQCTKCEYVFCTKCLDSYPCSINGAECDNLNALYKQNRTKDTEETIKTLNFMKREGINRRCPVCKMFIEKTSGCNKMTCFNCSNYFCYLCGLQIQEYDHFGASRCPLFNTAPDKVNQQIDVRRPVYNLVVEGGEIIEFALNDAQKKSCPSCGQKSWKTSKNNDITCWACAKHFCFLCGVMTKGTKHFSATGCRQHTDI